MPVTIGIGLQNLTNNIYEERNFYLPYFYDSLFWLKQLPLYVLLFLDT